VATYNLALAYVRTKQHEKAVPVYGRLIEMNYKADIASTEKARIHFNKREYDSAIKELDRRLTLGDVDAEVHYMRGFSLLKQDDLEAADRAFAQAISINPNHTPSVQNKAFTSYKLGNYSDAVQDFSRLLEIQPDEKSTILNRGLASLQLKEYAAATRDFSLVIDQDPHHALAYYNRASALASMSKKSEACEDMRQSAKLGYSEAFNHIRSLCDDLVQRIE